MMQFLQKNISLPILFIIGIVLWVLINQTFWENIKMHWLYDWSYQTKTNSGDIFTSVKIKQVENIIQKQYYHFSEKSRQEIEDGVISSLVNSLWDKHSSYFNIKDAKDFSEVLRGDFEWIGAVIDEDIKWIIIRKVFDGSPAQKAWLESGDIMTNVWGESMIGLSTEEAVKKIRWPKGSKVKITYIHTDKDVKNEVEIIRDTVFIPSAAEKMLTGSIWYIEVASFWEHTTEEFQKSFQNLTNSGAKGIILDFRNNGGGYLDTAVDILSFLLPEKSTAVITRENSKNSQITLFTKQNKFTNTNIPVVMLINELSASATEITAWALQDFGRAIILGEKSYGKWSVQEPFALDDGSILKITIGKWYTPKDRWIDGVGITPDVIIPILTKDFANSYDRQFEWAKKALDLLIKNENSIEKTKLELKSMDFIK